MKMLSALVLICMTGLATSCAKPQASIQTADGPAACEDFQKNQDGSWTPQADVQVTSGGTAIKVPAKTTSFKAGVQNSAGIDVGAMLDNQCRS